MELFLLIAPNLLGIELIIIIGCLATEWLDLLKEWSLEAIERDYRQAVENNNLWIEMIKFEAQKSQCAK